MTPTPTTMPMERPPGFPRRVLMNGRQVMGLLLLMLLPLLALLRLLGDGEQMLEASAHGLVLRVEVPATARYGNAFQLRMKAGGAAALAGQRVNIAIAEDYLSRFNSVHARPEMVRLTDEAGVIVQELPSDAREASVVIELTPKEYGWAHGTVRATPESGTVVELKFKTLVFP